MICISGKKRSGKDTAANFFRSYGGYKTVGLADKIKDCLCEAFIKNDVYFDRKYFDGIDFDRERPLNFGIRLNQQILLDAVFIALDEYGTPESENLLDYKVEKAIKIISNMNENLSIRRFMQFFGTDIMCMIFDLKFWLLNTKFNRKSIVTDIRQPWENDFFRSQNVPFIFIIGAYDGYVDDTKDAHITERGLIPEKNDIIVYNKDKKLLREEIKCLIKKMN